MADRLKVETFSLKHQRTVLDGVVSGPLVSTEAEALHKT